MSKNVAFEFHGDFGGTEAWRLLSKLNHALVGMNWRVADRELMNKTVRAHMGLKFAR